MGYSVRKVLLFAALFLQLMALISRNFRRLLTLIKIRVFLFIVKVNLFIDFEVLSIDEGTGWTTCDFYRYSPSLIVLHMRSIFWLQIRYFYIFVRFPLNVLILFLTLFLFAVLYLLFLLFPVWTLLFCYVIIRLFLLFYFLLVDVSDVSIILDGS